jgi:hypothetical protein
MDISAGMRNSSTGGWWIDGRHWFGRRRAAWQNASEVVLSGQDDGARELGESGMDVSIHGGMLASRFFVPRILVL